MDPLCKALSSSSAVSALSCSPASADSVSGKRVDVGRATKAKVENQMDRDSWEQTYPKLTLSTKKMEPGCLSNPDSVRNQLLGFTCCFHLE